MALSGSGTSSDPYLIGTLSDLDEVRNDLTAYYKQTADIDASGTSTWDSGAGWTPIGDPDTSPFTGQYDGQEYTISGLYIDRRAEENDGNGLFGHCQDGATFLNIILENVSIDGYNFNAALVGVLTGNQGDVPYIENCHSSGSIEGRGYSGGLVGEVEWVEPDDTLFIKDCTSSVNIGQGGTLESRGGGLIAQIWEGGIVKGCHATGNVKTVGPAFQTDDGDGGLVGMSQGARYIDCYATGDVDGYRHTGGLTGTGRPSDYHDCYATGEVTNYDGNLGGFVGQRTTTYNTDLGTRTVNSYSVGQVNPSPDTGNVGGFVGSATSGAIDGFQDCYFDEEASGQTDAVGAAGPGSSVEDADIEGKTTDEMQQLATFDPEWDIVAIGEYDEDAPNTWYIDEGVDYPRLWYEYDIVLEPPVITAKQVEDFIRVTIEEGAEE